MPESRNKLRSIEAVSLGENQSKRNLDVSSQPQCEAAAGEADEKP